MKKTQSKTPETPKKPKETVEAPERPRRTTRDLTLKVQSRIRAGSGGEGGLRP